MTKTSGTGRFRPKSLDLGHVGAILLAAAAGIAVATLTAYAALSGTCGTADGGCSAAPDAGFLGWGEGLVSIELALAAAAGTWVSYSRGRTARLRSAEIHDRVRSAEDDLSAALAKTIRAANLEQRRLEEALLLSRVWQSVAARLDQYHDDAQSQGRRAFNAAMIAMWVGFLVTAGCGAVAVFLAITNTGAVVIGGLGAVSAALSGYVARTHLRAYDAVSGQLQGYFSQPVEASRYLSAERAIHVSGLPEDARRDLMKSLVAAMVAPPTHPQV